MDSQKTGIFIVSSDPLIRNYLKTFLTHFGQKIHCSKLHSGLWPEVESVLPALVVLDTLGDSLNWEELETVISKMRVKPAFLFLQDPKGIIPKGNLWQGDRMAFVQRPLEPGDLKIKIQRLLGQVSDRVKGSHESDDIAVDLPKDDTQTTGTLVGFNRKFKAILDIIDRVAATDVTVLVRGESGTGKELVARRIHEQSPRRERPFIKVLCPAIPDPLLESELFGYEKGSFTGAFRRKPGRFEFANGGTIFLDEIGDISFSLQSKLLQVLQEGEFARLGGREDIRVDVRIVAATNRDLEKAVREGAFREDLFYRLNVVNVYVPPLRDRSDDIPLLVRYFLDRFNQQFNKRMELSSNSMRLFLDYHWPGNIREMENTLKGMVILGNEKEVMRQFQLKIELHKSHWVAQSPPMIDGPPVLSTIEYGNGKSQENHLAPERRKEDRKRRHTDHDAPPAGVSSITSLKKISREASRKAEERMIKKVLEQTQWNRKQAAKLLGISYKALLYKVKNIQKKSV